MGDPTTCVYQFICDKNGNDDMNIIQYFIIHGLGLFIMIDSYMAHMFCEGSLSHNTEVPIYIKKNKYHLSLNKNTTSFDWEDDN